MMKINSDLINKIKQKIASENSFYISIKLEISKIFFIFVTTLYFFLYLGVLAGFQIEYTSKLLFITYPIFLLSTFTFLYDLCSYGLALYSENKSIKYVILSILTVTYGFLVFIHLGFKI
ncbi:MAG: hypothetical protein PHS92_02795 [Candidatus Gracilibacteria bacterium]|nr:hypothetical protein [Candidatus Gracilibacteria bacterium]